MDNVLRPAYGAFIVEIVFGEFGEIYSHRFLAVGSYCQGEVNAVKAAKDDEKVPHTLLCAQVGLGQAGSRNDCISI